jgi:hypothetical protein
MVFGLRLAGGRDVVVKARADHGRAVSCVAAQARLAGRGFPCARPLTPVTGAGSLAVHAEEFRPGGEVLRGDSPEVAVRCAEVFARLMAELATVTVAPPLPNPPWVRWDHTDSGVWPAIGCLDSRDQSVVPAYVVEAAVRTRRRLLAAGLPCALGHADFEAQNLRWHGRQVWTVHDWDSLAWQPEAALVGAASGSFASAGPPGAGAGRELRGVPGGLPEHSRALVHGRGAGDRVGGQLVDGGLQRPGGSAATPRHPGVPRYAPRTSSRTPPQGQCLIPAHESTEPPPERPGPGRAERQLAADHCSHPAPAVRPDQPGRVLSDAACGHSIYGPLRRFFTV